MTNQLDMTNKKPLKGNSKDVEKVLSSDFELKSSGFTQRLALLIGLHKNITAFAKSSNMSLSGLQRLASGGMPTLPRLIAIADAGNVSIEWLATGEGEMAKEAQQESFSSRLKSCAEIKDILGHIVDLAEFYFVPRYNIKASAGNGAVIGSEAPMHQMSFRKYWIDNILKISPKGLAVIGVTGDSMTPEINDKDVLLINTLDTAPRDGIYVIRLNDDLIVKRIQYIIGGTIKIISANPVYDPFEINIKNVPSDFAVIGRVVWFGRTMP